MKDLEIKLTLVNKAGTELRRASREIAQEAQRSGDSMARSYQKSSKALSEHQKNLNAYQILGIRSEIKVKQAIHDTEAAYERLQRSGVASANDIARAFTAKESTIKSLRGEIGQLEQQTSRWSRAANKAGAVMMGIGASYQVGRGILEPKVRRITDYDTAMRSTANLMDDGNTMESRAAANQRARAMVEAATAFGGTRDATASGMYKMFQSGMSEENVRAAMIANAKIHTATGGEATHEDLAAASEGILNFGITADRLAANMGRAYMGDKLGSFGIAEQAKWLKPQLSTAGANGYRGERDFAFISALNQSAAKMAGSLDEAGNNVKQVLAAHNMPAVKKAIADAKGFKDDTEVDKLFSDGLLKGKNPLEVLDDIMQEELAKSAKGRAIKQEMVAARTPEQWAEIGEKLSKFQEGSVVGSILTDQERRMGYLAFAADRENFNKNFQAIQNADEKAFAVDYQNHAESNRFKFEQAGNKKEAADEAAYGDLVNVLGRLADVLGGMDTSTVAGLTAAKDGGTVLAAGIGGAALGNVLIGGRTGMGNAAGIAKMAGRAAPLAARAVPVLGGAAFMYSGNQTINSAQGQGFFEGGFGSRASGYVQSAAGGAALGGVIGSVVPVIGTAVGAAVGGGIGLLSAAIADFWKEEPQQATPLESPELTASMAQLNQSAQTNQQASQQYVTAATENQAATAQLTNAASQMTAAAAQMQAAAGKPIPVTVTVQNGNIMAYINQAAARAAAKN